MLGRLGVSTSAELVRALAASEASALRLLHQAAPAVVKAGQASQAGELALVQPPGSWLALDGSAWPLPPESADGGSDRLPSPLLDMRPQGYVGRLSATQVHEALGIGADPRQWTVDDVLWLMLHCGADLPGHFILGERALRLWPQLLAKDAEPLAEDELAQAYPALAARALAEGSLGSSAGGELPKFTALRRGPAAPAASAPGRRSGRASCAACGT